MDDDLKQILHDWAFNVMLECSGRERVDSAIVIGGDTLNLHDLDRLLDWLAVQQGIRKPDCASDQ